ncbi:zinc-binding oxidoreductase [Apiospora marii]|uniref:Zinc-binding oxidoreductase n=1 Tax=Apiospora marii TaxID=335849 RepID=A0ABR1R1R7_9PEZI
MYTRQGHSPTVKFPRIIGIECIGRVVAYGGSVEACPHPIGSKIGHIHYLRVLTFAKPATCMGGLGREIPGSYAEYTCVDAENIRLIPPTSLPVSVLASLPEMMQTTWGSLVSGLDLKAGDSLLVRGATSSIGLCALQLARTLGAARVAGTTRNGAREQMLRDCGADEVFVDSGEIADQVAQSPKGGFDKVLELNGTTTLRDSLRCAVTKGTVCMTGIQGGSWEIDQFIPMSDLPNRVRLCAYGGGPEDFHEMPLEQIVKDVEEGRVKIPVKQFKLDEIQAVHRILESGGGGAKMVVVVSDD